MVCVGGDGTLNEVVNGLLSGDHAEARHRRGVVPSGTGADFARSLGIPRRPEEACLRLPGSRTVSSDLGVVSYTGGQGPARRYFVNAAGLGYDAEVARSRDGFNRCVRGTVPYLLSLAATLLAYQNKDVVVSIDQARDERRINALVVAVGRFFGGGMKIAPGALLDDGYFDVVTIGDVGRLELVYNVPRVYRGTHLQNPKIRVEKARDVRVESDQPVLIQADGELLGLAPAQFEIIPGALTFLC